MVNRHLYYINYKETARCSSSVNSRSVCSRRGSRGPEKGKPEADYRLFFASNRERGGECVQLRGPRLLAYRNFHLHSKIMKAAIYKFAYPFLKIYWFIFRPKTQGVQCLILSGDELLLIRHTYGRLAWTLAGGGIKKGETKEEAVKREIKEELGLDITPEYRGEFTHNTEYKIDTVYCFVVTIEKVEPKIDRGEIKEAKWWNINNLPKDHSRRLERVLLMYQSR